MAVIKCKMCGGDLVLVEGQSVAECEYCGSRQTVPSADNEKKLNLFARANRLRAACDFDKAAGIYESIVADFPEEAEAYWGLVLCKYGIEYVDDPATGKKIPTCHRSSFESVMDDDNFDQAQENADALASRVYREEAKQIEEIRKGIVAVSSNEKPYDIFICYKETDSSGDRTLDSVLAQDVYDALTAKGYRTFFARITLEDKLGQEYEPYIFAALNSAKIMLAVGTCYEHYNAVWVKNEWSRYLKLMTTDKSKHLIPCYKGLDAYDMPKEFARLQAQDLGKMGAIQDILRGVEKLLPRQMDAAVIPEKVIIGGAGGNNKIASLLDRGNMALEDGDWAKADSFFEDVLNNDSKNAQAYLGKTLAQERCRTVDALVRKRKDVYLIVQPEKLYIQEKTAHIGEMAERYSLPGYVEQGTIRDLYRFDLGYTSEVSGREKQYREEESWWQNHRWLSRAEKFAFGAVAETIQNEKKHLFAQLNDRVKKAQEADARSIAKLEAAYDAHIAEADDKAEQLYQEGCAHRENDYNVWLQQAKKETFPWQLHVLAEKFAGLGDYKDSENLAGHCRKRAAEEQVKLDAAAEAKRIADAKQAAARKKKNLTIACLAVIAIIAVAAVTILITSIQKKNAYNGAIELYRSGEYSAAEKVFAELGDYQDCEELVYEVRFAAATEQFELGNYEIAEEMFRALEEHPQSKEMLRKIEQKKDEMEMEAAYNAAVSLLEQKHFLEARNAFASLGDYSDSAVMTKETQYQFLYALWELYSKYDLNEPFVEIEYGNCRVFFSLPEELYNQIAGDFEYACGTVMADAHEIYPLDPEVYEDVEGVKHNQEGKYIAGRLIDVIAAGMENLGDYKDAAEFDEKIREHQYSRAFSMKEAGDYENAITLFTALGDFKDSAEQLKQCEILPYVNAEVGDILTYGSYQGNVLTWRVLAREGNSVLMITEKCVDERHFQSNQNDPKYYKDSPIRKFLNQTFYQKAFTEEQKSMIQEKRLATTGGDVTDKLFLLSDREANKYFTSDADRVSRDGKSWYLRTVNSVLLDVLNYRKPIAMMVTGGGQVYQNDWTVDYERGIRPAMWIDISSYVAQMEQ